MSRHVIELHVSENTVDIQVHQGTRTFSWGRLSCDDGWWRLTRFAHKIDAPDSAFEEVRDGDTALGRAIRLAMQPDARGVTRVGLTD